MVCFLPTSSHKIFSSETVWGDSLATSASHIFMFIFASTEQKTFFISPAQNPTGVLLLPWMMMMPGTKSSQIHCTHAHTHTCRHQRLERPNYVLHAYTHAIYTSKMHCAKDKMLPRKRKKKQTINITFFLDFEGIKMGNYCVFGCFILKEKDTKIDFRAEVQIITFTNRFTGDDTSTYRLKYLQ